MRRIPLFSAAAMSRLMIVSAFLLFGSHAHAQDAPAPPPAPTPVPVTKYISVPILNDGKTIAGIQDQITRAKPSQVIFDFNAGDQDAYSANVGPCIDLATFISRQNFVTVAYVHRKVTGHMVLPVLACQQIVFGPEGSLGEITKPGDGPLSEIAKNAYSVIVGQQHPAYLALVRKMYDPAVTLRKGAKAGGVWFVDLRDSAKFDAEKITVPDRQSPVPGAPDRGIGNFSAVQLRDLGLSNRTIESRQELSDLYHLTAASFRDDTYGGRAPVGFLYTLHGRIDGGAKEAVERMIRQSLAQNATHLFLQLECAGGDLQAARDLAQSLVDLQRPNASGDAIRIIAFIPDRAPDTAAVIALGCSEIVMSRRTDASPGSGEEKPSEAKIGDFEGYLGKHPDLQPALLIAGLRPVAEANMYPPILVDGMLDRDLQIVLVHRKNDRNIKRLLSEQEYQADKEKGEQSGWVLMRQVKAKGQLLTLSATEAHDLGLVSHVVETRDPNAVFALYGLNAGNVRIAAPAWLDRFADFLTLPPVTVLLVVIAFIGLFLEMKVPGATIPGIISALCFILIFWAHTQFSGQIAVLAGLLFMLGLILIMLEVFVLPGFGVAGITGILLLLGSLGLVTLDQTPTSWAGVMELAGKMATYLFAMIGALSVVLIIARYLPNVPFANRLLLAPPPEKVAGEPDIADLPGAETAANLLGAVGTTQTVLRPAGTVRFGEQFVDVVSEGGWISAGTRVQVVEVEGTRIVVKEV